MIHRNVVQIETMESIGTGIMYPCKVHGDLYDYRMQYFIVFTNSHVLNTIGIQENEQNKDFKSQIIIRFFDNMRNEVPQNQIEAIRVYNSGSSIESKDDIAALFLTVNGTVPITLERHIDDEIVENRSTLYMEGFPGVLLNDEVSSRIQLEGVEKTVFPPNEQIGIYQITDDYHWYNTFQDRQLLQGLSGGPVYRIKGKECYLLGMAQSVSDIHMGENPFKLMYYIKMSHILNHLREANCIIFWKDEKDKRVIEWIYGEKEDLKEKITLLLLGGSGAGKSSFAKDFAYHGNEICSTSDGQTTRTKVIYEYQIKEKNPRAEVKFLTQEEFIDQMTKRVGSRPALLVMEQLFTVEKIQDEKKFLVNCHKLLLSIQAKRERVSHPKLIGDINAILRNELDYRYTLKCYEELIDTLMECFPIYLIKYMLDSNLMHDQKVEYKKLNKTECDSMRIWNELYENNNHEYGIFENDVERQQKVVNAYRKYCESSTDNEIDDFVLFQEQIIEACSDIDFRKASLEQWINEQLNRGDFRKRYVDEMLYCEGFFNICEFQSILEVNYEDQFYAEISKNGEEGKLNTENTSLFQINDMVLDEESDDDDKSRKRLIVRVYQGVKAWYRAVHVVIKAQLKKHYIDFSENNLQLIINLNLINKEKRKLLQQCLQVTQRGSLTGMINHIKIYDMVSDEYAHIMKELGIQTFQLVDTCGLDHIEYYDKQKLKDLLYDNLYYYEEQKIVKLSDISVLYVKKLDSGKPDELRTVLPCVREVFPSSPVYCVFTGIDIFYRTEEEIESISWKKNSDKMPKAVQYILSKKGRENLCCNSGKLLDDVDENMYIVMRNNLIPYCGDKQLIRNKYQFYRNNQTYIRKLLASISMKEYSSLEVIDPGLVDCICNKMDNTKIVCYEKLIDNEKNLFDLVEELIKEIFAEASLVSSSFRYNTKQADITSFCKRNKMGYYCTYRHQLNQLFHEAYSRVIFRKGNEIATFFHPTESALVAALNNLEFEFLGEDGNLIKVKFKEGENKNEFRRILDDMYALKDVYTYHPLEEEMNSINVKEMRDTIFDDIFNLRKGVDNPDILRRFASFYFICMQKQISVDNCIKSKNMLRLNPDFEEKLQGLMESYVEKFRTGEGKEEQEKIERQFSKMMQYYFRDLNSK